MIKRAVVYSRVSSDAQERDGTSLDTQEREAIKYVEANNWHLQECIRDTASGYNLDRIGIEHLRQMVRSGNADVFVFYAVDRLSRNQNHIGVLFDEAEQYGVKLDFVTEDFEETAVGRFILAARAFAGEVEREKIAERTMRGKAERARSGRLPQGTGKGCYGYIYNKETGRRDVNSVQAAAVKAVFEDFVRGVSISSIANKLNDAGLPTLTGAKWYPVTIHHILRNETYSGKTVYRKTVALSVRDPHSRRRKKTIALRDESEWIEVPDASPPLITEELYIAAQRLLDDPERRRKAKKKYEYGLSGRIRCSRCGRAMVGQTLKKKFSYYRCRRAYASPHHDRCDATYVRAEDLETAVREAAAALLANPKIIIAEQKRLRQKSSDHQENTRTTERLNELEDQRKRLVKLYQMGEIQDEYFQSEVASIRANMVFLESQLTGSSNGVDQFDLGDLSQTCEQIRKWVEQAEGDDFALIAEALQLRVLAEKGRGELVGVIPQYAPEKSHADVRSMVINSSP